MKQASFDLLASLLYGGSGLVIGREKLYLLETRLAPILREQRLADLDALADRLRLGGAAALEQRILEAMTTNESFFFRDEKPFTHFRLQTLPQLHAVRPPGTRLRVWSAAASSGQEAYSLAMIVAESRGLLAGRGVEIIGTDLSTEQLARAQQGLYSQFEVQRGLPMQMLVKYFTKEATQWRVRDSVRAGTSFRQWNLLGDLRPLGQFDVVFCRNVLIYFDLPTKTRVLDAIARQMTPDGVLYLGGAETVLGVSSRFASVGPDRCAYTLAASGAAAAGATSRTADDAETAPRPAAAPVSAPPRRRAAELAG